MYELQDVHFWHVAICCNLFLMQLHRDQSRQSLDFAASGTSAQHRLWEDQPDTLHWWKPWHLGRGVASSFGHALNSGQLGALPSFKGNALLLGCSVAFCLPEAISQLPALLHAWFTYNLAGKLLCGPPKRLLTPGRSYFKMLLWQYKFSLLGNNIFSKRRKIDHSTIFTE